MTTTTRPTVRLTVTAVLIPLLATVASLVLLLSWRDDLPDPVASHWGLGGAADGFSSLTGLAWLLAVVGLVGIAVAVAAGRSGTPALARTLAGTGAGTVVFIDALLLISTGAQRGLADAAGVSFSAWWILSGVAAGLAGALVAVIAVPSWQATPAAVGPGPDALPLGSTERAVWSAVVSSGRAGTAVVATAVAVTLILTVVTRMWWLSAIAALLVLVTAAMLSIRVTVDPSGLQVRGRLGWPRTTLPVEQITSVSTVQVRALRDFGGWGYRFAATGPLKGSRGFVLHSGPAIRVTTVDGRSEVTVVEDAATGAALLEAYRLRQTGGTAR